MRYKVKDQLCGVVPFMTELFDRQRHSLFAVRLDGASLLVLAAILAGAYMRLAGIDDWGFWTDEFFHVFAAHSYLADGSFHIPWQADEYTRAKLVTLITAASFWLFGESELAARLPFALINLLFIIVAYPVVKALFSRNVAVIFVVAMCFSSFAIGMSRECRMYTLFQLLYFLMATAFFRGLEYRVPAAPGPGAGVLESLQARLGVSLPLLLLALGISVIALELNLLTVTLGVAAVAYAMAMMVKEGLSKGLAEALLSRYGIVVILAIFGVLLIALASSDLVRGSLGTLDERPKWNALNIKSMYRLIFFKPVWMTTEQSNLQFYYVTLVETHPFLWIILPPGLFMAVYKYRQAGTFFAVTFVVLFLIHSFVLLGRQSDRYIFYLLPFFVTLGAIGAEAMLLGVISVARSPKLKLSSGAVRLFYLSIALSMALFFALRAEAWHSRIEWFAPRFADWKDLDPAILEAVTDGRAITSDRFRFTYYFGQFPDHVIDANDVDYDGRRNDDRRSPGSA